jgi:hypothetical protein
MFSLHSSHLKLPIPFEFMTGHGKAILSAAKIPKNMRQLFWEEAFQSAALMNGLIFVKVQGKCRTKFALLGGGGQKYE